MPRLRSRRTTAGIAVCLTGFALLVSAAPASAVTIGQLAPTPGNVCGGEFDLVQPTVTSGNSYVVPSTGGVVSWTVTSWSTNASSASNQLMAMKIFRKLAGPAEYQVVGHEGPHALAAGPNTFPAHLPVKPGDVLGTHYVGGGACAFGVPGETILALENVDLADGASGSFQNGGSFRLNATAEVIPTSDFSLGKIKAKPNGTAILTVDVPNPGDLTVSGKGVKASSAGATAAKRVTAAGKVKVTITAKGKKKAKLLDTGKVTVKPKITFTPTGGTASTESRKVKLRRK